MPEYNFYYTRRGPPARLCEAAFNHWRDIRRRNEHMVLASDWANETRGVGITLSLREEQLPMVEQLRTGQKWFGEDAVACLSRLAGNSQVASQRYVMYTNDSVKYHPAGQAVLEQDYDAVMHEFAKKHKDYKRAKRRADEAGKTCKVKEPVVPAYLTEGANRLPILVTRENSPTVWFGTAAVDWARMVESMS